MIFVESIMDPYDALAPITHSSNKGAELDYGPRGPQHRHNQQLRPSGHGERNTETSAAAQPAML
jgi:indolepyruvate decarboxylase